MLVILLRLSLYYAYHPIPLVILSEAVRGFMRTA